MKGYYKLFLPLMIFAQQGVAQPSDYKAVVEKYIQQYKGIAVVEMQAYRIPASITLAQGIIESSAGRSELAVDANNHFGIKCHKEWTGKRIYKDDDTKNECFRWYDSPLESFRDHSWFLTSRDRYKGLFNLDITDYKGWAHGLKSAGYATNPAYASLLIRIIETYALDRFDRADFADFQDNSLKDMTAPEKQAWLKKRIVASAGPGNRSIYENNRLRMIIAGADDNLYIIARDFNLSIHNLLKYNDLSKSTDLKSGQFVYLEKKRRKGAVGIHKVRDGESLYDVSQTYGIRLKNLCKRNDVKERDHLPTGTVLRLR